MIADMKYYHWRLYLRYNSLFTLRVQPYYLIINAYETACRHKSLKIASKIHQKADKVLPVRQELQSLTCVTLRSKLTQSKRVSSPAQRSQPIRACVTLRAAADWLNAGDRLYSSDYSKHTSEWNISLMHSRHYI